MEQARISRFFRHLDDKSELNKARIVTVGEDHAERRLDNFLLSVLKGVPRSRIYRMVRSGEVRVNKGRAKVGYRLQADDQVRIPPVHMNAASDNSGRAKPSAELLRRIIFEDAGLLVVDKPAGLAVHGGSGIKFGLIEQLRMLRTELHYLELAHRLDRATSGCLIVAKKRSVLRNLHEQFREGEVRKKYLALLLGELKSGAESCRLPLQTRHRENGERHVVVDEAGKAAVSHFRPLAVLPEVTYAEIEIETGRTHQIRVHAAAIGYPVLGDQRYGSAGRELAAGVRVGRLCLHAASLNFNSPGSDDRLVVDSPLDAEMRAVLTKLEGRRA